MVNKMEIMDEEEEKERLYYISQSYKALKYEIKSEKIIRKAIKQEHECNDEDIFNAIILFK